MLELIDRIGITLTAQVIIEAWNGLFLLTMIFTMLLFKKQSKDKIPLTNEIIVFYAALMLYNVVDIICLSTEGCMDGEAYAIRRVGEFLYCGVGEYQTLLFLYLVRKNVAEENGIESLRKAAFAFELLQILPLTLLVLTPFTNWLYSFDEMNRYHRGPLFFVWFVLTFLSFLFVIVSVFIYRKRIDKFTFKVIMVASLIPLVFFAFGLFDTNLSFNNLAASAAAFVIFVLYERHKTEYAVNNAKKLEQAQTQLAESRLALEESKNQTLMAQIQPHFINNSLMAIRSQCYDYPEVYRSITNFSRYLRSNFEALGDTRLILFEQEMENIEAYLSLERENFGDRLKVEYGIECDDFLIPALSVQPLVENAVRHGVGTYENGGTVRIMAWREDGKVIIEVIDDGSGRSNITEQQSKRKGIGIDNVRKRLRSMSGGELEITMGDHGTTARITVADVSERREEA